MTERLNDNKTLPFRIGLKDDNRETLTFRGIICFEKEETEWSTLGPVSPNRCRSFSRAEERVIEEKICVSLFYVFWFFLTPAQWESPLKYSFLKCKE